MATKLKDRFEETMNDWTVQGTPKALANMIAAFDKHAAQMKNDELVEQPYKAAGVKMPKRPTKQASLKSRLIAAAETVRASGATGVSLDRIIESLGVPAALLSKKMMRTKLRTLARYLEAKGVKTVLVNEKYFVTGAVQSVRSIEEAQRLLPIGKAAAGLHFLKVGIDWLMLGEWQHSLNQAYGHLNANEPRAKAGIDKDNPIHGEMKTARENLDKSQEQLSRLIWEKAKQQAEQPSH